MDIKKITNELCVEVYATNNEGTTMIIRKIIEEAGVHETYMNVYDERLLKEKNENGIGLHGDSIEEIERKKAINRYAC